MNKWLTHYLYSVDNGIETMASVRVQSNIDDTPDFYEDKVDEVYSFVIDNASVKVDIPTK